MTDQHPPQLSRYRGVLARPGRPLRLAALLVALFGIGAAFQLQVVLILGGSLLAVVVLLWASWRLDVAVAAQTRAYAQELATRAQLEAAVATLEARLVIRDAFVGVMSHELRTPVTTIYGAA